MSSSNHSHLITTSSKRQLLFLSHLYREIKIKESFLVEKKGSLGLSSYLGQDRKEGLKIGNNDLPIIHCPSSCLLPALVYYFALKAKL